MTMNRLGIKSAIRSVASLISGADTNLDGVVNDRANIVGNPYSASATSRATRIQEFLNPAGLRHLPALMEMSKGMLWSGRNSW